MPHDPQRAFDSSEFVLDDSHYSAYRDYRKRMARDHPNISAMPAPEYFHTQTDFVKVLDKLLFYQYTNRVAGLRLILTFLKYIF